MKKAGACAPAVVLRSEIDQFFGASGSKNNEIYRKFGLKERKNEEMRDDFLNRARAVVDALGLRFDVLSYEEHSMGSGSDARAVAFVEITTPARTTLFGVGLHENIVTASLMAILSAVNRALQRGLLDDSMPAATAG